MTTTLYDEDSNLHIPPDHLEIAGIELAEWFAADHQPDQLTQIVQAFCRFAGDSRPLPDGFPGLQLVAIMWQYQWDAEVAKGAGMYPAGTVSLSFTQNGTLTNHIEDPLWAIRTHLQGSWHVLGADDDRFGGRYELNVGKVANLDGRVVWSETEPSQFRTADWKPVVLYEEGPEG